MHALDRLIACYENAAMDVLRSKGEDDRVWRRYLAASRLWVKLRPLLPGPCPEGLGPGGGLRQSRPGVVDTTVYV